MRKKIGAAADDAWQGLLAEGVAYIRMALDPEVQRIVLLDGPTVQWRFAVYSQSVYQYIKIVDERYTSLLEKDWL